MAEIVDQISEVETKTLPTGTILYLIKDSKGKEYSTVDRAIAQEAYALVGTSQTAHIDYTEKKNERGFVNRYLNAFSIQPDEGGFKAPAKAEAPPAGLFDDTAPPSEEGRRELQIAKAVALKAAVELLQYFEPEDRTSTNVTGIAEYFTQWLLEWKP
jgi:hypothetical protein